MHAYLQLCSSAMHVSVCMLNSALIACFYIYSREIYHIILYFSFILQWTVRLITLHTLQWVQTKQLAWQALQLILWWILVSYFQPHPILPLFSTHPTQDQSVTSLTCHGPVVCIPIQTTPAHTQETHRHIHAVAQTCSCARCTSHHVHILIIQCDTNT